MDRIFCVFSLVCFSVCSVFAQPFEHLSVNNGLSQSTVLAIHQDSRGYMWFGTRDRLNRYDGRNFKIYTSDPADKRTISTDDYIYAITEDSEGKLWIGTQNGVNCYSPEFDSFERILYNPSHKNSLSFHAVLALHIPKSGRVWLGTNGGLSMLPNSRSRNFKNFYVRDGLADNQVYAVFEDSKGNVWVGTSNGLTLMIPGRNGSYSFKTFRYSADNGNSISSDYIKTITEDHKGRIWIGTEKHGFNLFLPETNSFKRFKSSYSSPNGLSGNFIRKITAAKDGRLLIGTMSGLNIFNPETSQYQVFKHDFENSKSLSDNSIKDVIEDKEGSIWVGTMFGGVNVSHKNTVPFNVFTYSRYRNSISSNIISVITADENDNLWIGTEGHGLNFYNRQTGQFKNYTNDPSNTGSIGSNTIKAIFKDSKDRIWIGLFEGGLELFNAADQTFRHFKPDRKDPKALGFGYVSAITEDKRGRLWVGTSTMGLDLYDPRSGGFIHYREKSESPRNRIGSNYIRVLFTDSKGGLWVGTAAGLNFMMPGGDRFVQFKKGTNGLNANYINCIKEDRNGDIWIGAHRGGISRFDTKKKRFSNYTSADGLVSDNVVGIEEDNEGNLWISTDRGLSKFNRKESSFKNYYASDGLPTNEFNYNATYKDQKGTLYFGSYNGLVTFFPKNLQNNKSVPKVYISGLSLFNTPVKVNGPDSLLRRDLPFTEKIEFKASQNIFTIDFVSLNLVHPERNRYAYKLEGFEKDWNYVRRPSATYTNLPPGTYTFLVKGSNNDGIWNPEPTAVTIKIHPPLWRTWWAYLIYFAIFVTAWYYINRFLRRQERLETDLYYEHLNNERQQELYQSKLDFFTRISHEIRTPLTLIFAPLEKIIDATRNNPTLNFQLQSIKNNSDRLLRLISELLDFRKIETGNLKLHVSRVNLVDFCGNICSAFQSQTTVKNISLSFECDEDQIEGYIDTSQMEKVLFNLLSNAFKYTPENGAISFKLVSKHQHLQFIVRDTGIGIPEEEQSRVFDNFYQVEAKNNQPVGWGIGLALVKNIIDLHKGEIALRSKPAKPGIAGFTEFTISLLKGKGHFSEEELKAGENMEETAFNFADPAPAPFQEALPNTEKQYSVLVVEDNDELRQFIVRSLEPLYVVSGCSNGLDGLNVAREELPDIIITDVTMPGMDGFQLCSSLKQDDITSHIPVILLTAMASHMHQVSGLESGADVYITKPFSIQVLELSLRNLLVSREALKEKYSRQVMLMPRKIDIESPDEKFLNKMMSIVEEKMEDPDFNVSTLVSEIGMSQAVLYKKIKALTGLTITDMLKSLRLKRAVQLLEEGLNVSEVAYSVGFNDRKYFSKEFKKQYGKTPSEFLDQHGKTA